MLTDEQLAAIRRRNDAAKAALLHGSVPAMLMALNRSQFDVTALLAEVDRYHAGEDNR